MRKTIKYVLGSIALLLFFLVIDSTGVGFKSHIKKIKDWANGNAQTLKFDTSIKTENHKQRL